jgi:hypothetical protein
MTEPDAELQSLRRDTAAAHGLSANAARFLTGTTLAEIEAEAGKLARLIDASGEPPAQESSADAGPDLFGRMAESKASRKQALAALFAGGSQPRDEAGRFATRTTASFDGGARQAPPPRPPTHDELLGAILRERLADRGVSF